MAKRRNGEGSWGKKKVGNNNYVYFRDSDGGYTYGKTQKEVNEKRALKEQNKFTLSDKTTFGEYISQWLSKRQPLLESQTYDCYETMINSELLNFKPYDLANVQLHNLTSEKLQQYLNALSKKYSRATIEKMWVLIKKCIKYGEVRQEIAPNTTLDVNVPIESNVAIKKKDIPFLSMEDMEALYQVINLRNKNGTLKFQENAHALILIMYSGMRISEMTGLRWKNVNMEKREIYIRESSAMRKVRDGSSDKKYEQYNKTTKTPKSIRTIPLPDRGMEMIKYFYCCNPHHTPDDFVCLTRNKTQMLRRNVNKTLKRMIKESICSVRDFSPHALRHTYGSILLSQGVEIKTVSELLGHEKISTTYDIYIGILEKDKRQDIQRVFNTKS